MNTRTLNRLARLEQGGSEPVVILVMRPVEGPQPFRGYRVTWPDGENDYPGEDPASLKTAIRSEAAHRLPAGVFALQVRELAA
jgi:hypothetical protein